MFVGFIAHQRWRSGIGKLKQRCVWREELETIDEARAKIGAYVEAYHHRPHSGLNYTTPAQVAGTWEGSRDPSNPSGLCVNSHGVHANFHDARDRTTRAFAGQRGRAVPIV